MNRIAQWLWKDRTWISLMHIYPFVMGATLVRSLEHLSWQLSMLMFAAGFLWATAEQLKWKEFRTILVVDTEQHVYTESTMT